MTCELVNQSVVCSSENTRRGHGHSHFVCFFCGNPRCDFAVQYDACLLAFPKGSFCCHSQVDGGFCCSYCVVYKQGARNPRPSVRVKQLDGSDQRETPRVTWERGASAILPYHVFLLTLQVWPRCYCIINWNDFRNWWFAFHPAELGTNVLRHINQIGPNFSGQLFTGPFTQR